MRIVFAGTPDVAVPALQALADSRHDLVGVITRPDAVAGRGRRTVRSAVGQVADDLGIPVLTPPSARDPEFLAQLAQLNPDCCPVVAYGALLPPAALALPPHGWVNLHFSLLPAWRGAAPVQAAIRAGDDFTGACTFRIEEALDTGPIFGTTIEPIRPTDTAGELLDRLAVSGAHLLRMTIDGIEEGSVQPVPQSSDGVSYAGKITVADAQVNWDQPALAIERHVRSVTPFPGAWAIVNDVRLKLSPLRLSTGDPLPPGQLEVTKTSVRIGTKTAPVELVSVQPPGKRLMPAVDWARGLRL